MSVESSESTGYPSSPSRRASTKARDALVKPHSGDSRTLLSLLPLELLGEVCLNLDAYSLRNLLIAYEFLRKYFVVIEDAEPASSDTEAQSSNTTAPLPQESHIRFFDIPGLQRETATGYIPRSNTSCYLLIHEVRNNESIKEVFHGAGRLKSDYESYAPPHTNKFSFVYLAAVMYYEGASVLIPRIFDSTGASVEIHDCYYEGYQHTHISVPVRVQSHESTFQMSLREACVLQSGSTLESLNFLRLDDVQQIGGLELPVLVSLIIICHNGPTRLHGITTSRMRYLKVCYYDYIPLFSDIKLGNLGNFRRGSVLDEFPKHKGHICQFDLIRVPSLSSNLGGPLPPCKNGTVEELEEMQLSSFAQFGTINVYGGPDELVARLNGPGSRTFNLSWKKTDRQQTRATEDIGAIDIKSPFLGTLLYETVVPNSVFPSVTNQSVLYGISVHDHTGSLDMNGFFRKPLSSSLEWLVVESPKVPKSQRLSTDKCIFVPRDVLTAPFILKTVYLSGIVLDPELDRRLPTCNIIRCFHTSFMRGPTADFDDDPMFPFLVSSKLSGRDEEAVAKFLESHN